MAVPKTESDLYRQEHPVESEDLLLAKYEELEEELAKIPDDVKKVYLQAVEKCPDLVGQKEKLKFLRCEVFNADVSCRRNLLKNPYPVEESAIHVSLQYLVFSYDNKSLQRNVWWPTGTSDLKSLDRTERFCP